MRIALLCLDRGIPLGGDQGAAVHMRSLAAALLRHGHAVSAVVGEAGPADGCRALADAGLDVRPLRVAARGQREDRMREIDWHLARLAPDLVIERLSPLAPEGAELAAAAGIPHLYDVHAPLDEDATAHRGFTGAEAARAAFAVGFAASRGTVAVSDEVADWVRALAPPHHRVLVLPNGAAPEFFAPADEGLRSRLTARLGLRSGEFRIGFVGSFRPWHDLDGLVESAAALAGRIPTRLVLVGDGPARNAILERATALRLPVTLAGQLPHEAVPAALSLFDVAAVPYADEAACCSPLKLFESMASARAIVASATRPVTRVLRDGVDALLAPAGDRGAFADALHRFAFDPTLRGRLGAEARRTAEARHTWAGVSEHLLAFAESVRASHGAPCAR